MTLIEDKNTQLIDAIREAVKGREDYVYEGECVYFNEDGSPACLIGQGLAKLGYDVKALDCQRTNNALEVNANGTSASIVLDDLGFEPAVIVACQFAQRAQDRDKPWGEALNTLYTHLADIGVLDSYWRNDD